MSLPLRAIDRLFDRLTATYGAQFTSLYGALDPNAVKSAWAHELSGFGTPDGLAALAWALENLPERAPNVIQFRNLARRAPVAEAPKLPEPKADPERVAAELAKLRAKVGPVVRHNNLDWARRIVAKHDAGMKVATLPLRMAREALAPKSAMQQA